jgi:hypothetical protein
MVVQNKNGGKVLVRKGGKEKRKRSSKSGIMTGGQHSNTLGCQ